MVCRNRLFKLLVLISLSFVPVLSTYYFDPAVVDRITKANTKQQPTHHACILMLLEKEFIGTNLEHQNKASLERFVAKNLLDHLGIPRSSSKEKAIEKLIFSISCETQEHSGQNCQYCVASKDLLLNSYDQIAMYLKLVESGFSFVKAAKSVGILVLGACTLAICTLIVKKNGSGRAASSARRGSVDSQQPPSLVPSERIVHRAPANTPTTSPAEPTDWSADIAQLSARVVAAEAKLVQQQELMAASFAATERTSVSQKLEFCARIEELKTKVEMLAHGNLENMRATVERIEQIEARAGLAMSMHKSELEGLMKKHIAEQQEALSLITERIARLESVADSHWQSREQLEREVGALKEQVAATSALMDEYKIQIETLEALIRQQSSSGATPIEPPRPVPDTLSEIPAAQTWAVEAGATAPPTPGAAAAASRPEVHALPPALLSTPVLMPAGPAGIGQRSSIITRIGRPRERSVTLETSAGIAPIRTGPPLQPRPASPGHARLGSPTRAGVASRVVGSLERAADRTVAATGHAFASVRGRLASPVRGTSPKADSRRSGSNF